MCGVDSPASGLRKLICLVVWICAPLTIASAASGGLTTLVSFGGANGANPSASLVQGNDGNFYGTTLYGGTGNSQLCNNSGGCGTVFQVKPNGTLTTIYNFCSQNCSDGYFPNSALIQGTDGNLYGTTAGNGLTSSGGTVFKISPSGTLTTIYHFCQSGNCATGNLPEAGVIEGSDGNLYGTTARGGTGAACPYSYGCGTVFKLTTSGSITTLNSFCQQTNCADGLFPEAALVQGTDGAFYGTTEFGGTASCTGVNPTCGTVFKVTASPSFTLLYSFTGGNGGANPAAALLQGVDGNFYGTTVGATGSVFSITPSGGFTVLHVFNGADGGPPESSLVQALDGNFYGTTTSFGGGNSTIFKINSTGTAFSTLYTFSGPDGTQPQAGLIQAVDGNLYGTTYGGGGSQLGTVFKFTGPTAVSTEFVLLPTPCRLVDTRPQNGGNGPIQGGTWQTFVVPQLGNPPCGIPASATSYSLNVTVVPHGQLGFLTIWPAGRPQPYVSTMNSDGRAKANAAIVTAGASAAVSVYASNTTDLILDINGYFTTLGSRNNQFYPLTPCRMVDTRPSNGGNGPIQGGTMASFPVGQSPCLSSVPQGTNIIAYSLNFTVQPQGALGYLQAWAENGPLPTTSILNDDTGEVLANAAIVGAGTPNGGITVLPSQTTDVIVDINGYFAAPSTSGLSLYPTAPCRVLDTRLIGNGQPFNGMLNPPVNPSNSGCTAPASAGGYVFNATVVPFGPLWYLTLWPDPQTQPTVSTLNAGDQAVTSNMAIVPNLDGLINAYAAGSTQLILDISGYFAPAQ